MTIQPIAQLVIESYFRFYRRNKKLTLVFTGIALLIIGMLGVIGYFEKKKEDAQRQQTASYSHQIENLNTVETSLRNLVEFVQIEKQRLRESEKLLADLKNEEQMLKPIIEADRKTVTSLLEHQNKVAQQQLARERWIGFGLGVISSMVASLLIAGIRIGLVSRRKRSKAQKTDSSEIA
ncbi:MAG: hypothetical protein WAM70_08650 [Pyrinomonadaceae bacterium]